MKQYTDKDQTAKLIELGFPRPRFNFPVEDNKHPDYVDEDDISWSLVESYSIGELIEFLPITIEWTPRIIMENEIKYSFATMDSTLYSCNKNNELIDNLFDMCVKLKEEGVI